MARLSLIFIAICIFVSLSKADDVIVLTSENFDQVIAQHPLILVEFYAPWCGHCKRLEPEYAAAATRLSGIAPIAKVDVDNEQNRPLAERFEIRGFPTIKLFRDGKTSEYPGDRTADAIVAFMKKQTLPAVSELDSSEAVTKFSSEDRVVIVGFFDNKDSQEFTLFKQTAEQMRDSFLFGAVIGSAALNEEFGVGATPSVVLFKQFDERKNILKNSEFGTLVDFIGTYSVPLIDEVGPMNYKFYADSGLPLAYLFVDLQVEGQKDTYLEMVKPLAKESKGKVNWVYIDWAKYSKHAERLGLSGSTVPAIAIEKLSVGLHYAFDEKAEITASSVSEWFTKFLNDQLEPTVKSEEIPASNDGPVKVVVAKSYQQIVLDSTKDVLVEFYAPWCGHCKQLAPTYEQLGTTLAHVPTVVIAKIDATANDVDPKLGIRGFPTIKLFRADDKGHPVDYEGDRSLDDMIQFIKDNASAKFEHPVEGKDEL